MSANKRASDLRIVASSTGSTDERATSYADRISGQALNPTQPSSRAASSLPLGNDPQPGSSTRGRKAIGLAVLSTLKGSMKFLRKGCEIFPPLESAAETLLDALNLIDTTTQDERSSELHGSAASELPQWAIILSTYISDSQPERMSKGIEALAQVLRDQAEYIRAQQQRGRMRRFAESEQDIEELEQCYRRIEASFRQLQADASLSTWRNTDKQLKDSQLNALSPAHDARYDSSYSDKIERAGCFQNTRVAVLDRIRDWIYSFGAEKIYWMNGMAGTGKTTIAYSVCIELEQNGRLGASFFCSRASPECRDVSRIIPTIAYHLAQQFYPFRSALCRILENEADIGQRKISVQLEHLIRTPLLEVREVLPSGVVVVIDALDECSDIGTTEMMLNALFHLAADLPVRFFLTSRPEPSISNMILAQDNNSRSVLHLHNVEEQFVKADIETYLTVALAKLSLTDNQMKQLAEQAGILFIYAATIVRYLLTAGRGVNASARLATILSGGTGRSSKKDREIDRLYKTILDGALEDEMLEENEIEIIKLVLWTIICIREPVMKSTLGALLSLDDEQVSAALQPLQSVLHVSEGSEVVSTLHASFPDFMLSSERSGPLLSCDEAAQSNYLARRCLKVMDAQLRFNICNLKTSYRFDKDVPGLEERVEAAISPELFYACRYWAEHLRRSVLCDELLSYLDEFLHERLLFWMEVLNLKGWMGSGEKILVRAQGWIMERGGPPEIREFIRDARDFATTFAANPVRQSTPHIYMSVLPLVSKQSRVWKTYWRRTKGLLQVDGTIRQRQGAALAVWNVGSDVKAMACSPNDAQIASGYADGIIRVHDARNGTLLVGPFQGHAYTICSISFSPDGTRIISTCLDSTVRLWDARDGTPIVSPFDSFEPIGWAQSDGVVAFSPDGTCAISLLHTADDRQVRVWDMRKNTLLVRSFKGQTKRIGRAAISPDGSHIASISDEETVIRDLRDGTSVVIPLQGPSEVIDALAFSPDSTRVVSGSRDGTLRIWDTHTGALLAGPFETNNDARIDIWDVAISPDGTHIASAVTIDSDSFHEIWIWDVRNGTLLTPLEGHEDWITVVAFSSDGTRIISGSLDQTIRLWDMRKDTLHAETPNSHTGNVTAIAFSSDKTRIVCGSDDGTIQAWDARDGTPLASPIYTTGENSGEITSIVFSRDGMRILSCHSTGRAPVILVWDVLNGALLVGPLEGHSNRINSAVFSPDSTRIVSGSIDCTVRLWDAHSGAFLASPSEGHSKQVNSVSFSPDGTRIASGSNDCTIRVWDAHTGTILIGSFEAEEHAVQVTSVAFSPNGVLIISGCHDGTIQVWDAQTANLLTEFVELFGKPIVDAAFSPDGKRMISISAGCGVWVRDVESCSELTWSSGNDDSCSPVFVVLPMNGWYPSPVAITSDGARIVSCGNDEEGDLLGFFNRSIEFQEVLFDDYQQTPFLSRWTVRSDGWVMGRGSRALLWLPVDLRDIFPRPPASLLIHPKGSISTCWTNLLLGESWQQCFNPSRTTSSKP